MEIVDKFGKEISILYNGKTRHKTKFGSCLTIAIIIGLLVRISYMINKVIQGNDPTILFQERDVEDPQRFDINPNTFNIALAIQASGYAYVSDDSIISFDSYLETKSPVKNPITNKIEYQWTKTPFKLEKCNEDHLQIEDSKKYFQKTDLSSHYCFPKNTPLHIEGEFNSDNFAQIVIIIKKCKGDNCKDSTIIDTFLKQFFVEVLFSDVHFKPEIKENPFKFYGRDIFWENSIKFPKKLYMEFRNNYIESDFGLFLSNIKTDIYPSFQQANEQIVSMPEDTFSSLIIRFEKRKENHYKRFYEKGLSIISEIGGFSQVLTFLGVILTTFYSQTHFYLKLINNTFTLKQFKQNKTNFTQQEQFEIKNTRASISKQSRNSLNDLNFEKKNKESTKYLKIDVNAFNQRKSIYSHENLSPIVEINVNQANITAQKDQNQEKLNYFCPQSNQYIMKTNEQTLTIIEKVKEYKEKASENTINSKAQLENKDEQNLENKDTCQFKFSFIEYILSYIFKTRALKRKKAIFDYSIKQLYHSIDLQNIINKLNEIDKLKRILLSDDQLTLFDYLPKPTIQYTHKKDKTIFYENQNFLFIKKQKDYLEKIKTATHSYLKIQQKQKEVNTRIIKYLDENYKKIFEDRILKDQQVKFSQQQIQEDINQLNKQQTKNQTSQQSRNSITSTNEQFLDADQDQNNIRDKMSKYSIFEPSTKFFQAQQIGYDSN